MSTQIAQSAQKSDAQRSKAAPNQQAASAIRRYARRLNEKNVSKCCGKAEGLMTNWVRVGILPESFVFGCNPRVYPLDMELWQVIKNMGEAEQAKALRENVRMRQRADRGEAIAEAFPKEESARFARLGELGNRATNGQAPDEIAKALVLAGLLGNAIAAAAKNGESLFGKTATYWVEEAIKPIFESLAKKVEAAGSGGVQH